MARPGVQVKIDQRVSTLAATAKRNLVTRIVPRAFQRGAVMMRQAIRDELPDGNEPTPGSPQGSRAKQSKSAKARFPFKMKRTVSIKTRNNDTYVLKVVGVDRRGAHVNFDHGEKAKTQGRVHKLWWVDGVNERYATVNPRVQRRDIPKIVMAKHGTKIANAVEGYVVAAVKRGELL